MILIIPLYEQEKLFKKAGYNKPKALINIFGKPIIYYLLESINIDLIYIPYNQEYKYFRLEEKLLNSFPNLKFKFYELPNTINNIIETLNISLKQINEFKDCPILLIDSNNFYNIDIIKLWAGDNKIIIFEDYNEKQRYSYVEINKNHLIKIIDKKNISNLNEYQSKFKYSSNETYGFKSFKQLSNYIKILLDENSDNYNISSLIQMMIDDNNIFNFSLINIKDWICLSTPIQLKQFYNNYPVYSCKDNHNKIKQMRICFNLDNTLVTYPTIQNDYTSVKPINFNINFLKYLKSFGHIIIIYTSRRMDYNNGNFGKILCDIGKITFDTLDKFNIPFDEIYFGKPNADIYIDDLALNCFDDIEKSLGFYMDKIEPRDFNTLELDHIDLFTKKSEDLSGEIYYYKNIPNTLKDLFPLFINYDNNNNKWYTIEKINGITISSLYLSELLTTDILLNIMNSINRIHQTKIDDNNYSINIYNNYCDKLYQRFNNYDYSKFIDSFIIYEDLLYKLNDYEKCNRGKFSIIHGDPVMTNIIINNYDKLKFIDMRGKNGDIFTLYGDSLYDWGKLYQSLIGYDCILLDKNIDENYKNLMIKFFKDYFINLYSEDDWINLQIITKSLLFSLIPLHDNDKCIKYYNLISTI